MSKSKKTSAAGAVAVKAEKAEAAELAVFTPDENTSVAVRVDRAAGTLWLTQAEISALFGVGQSTVSEHLKNAEVEELAGMSVYRNFRYTAADGKSYTVKAYNLDAVLSVGYRVKSPRGVEFRRWASCVLRERVVGAVAVPAPVAAPALADRVAALERSVALLATIKAANAVLKRENAAIREENVRLVTHAEEAAAVVQDVGRIVTAAKDAAATLAEAAKVTEAAAVAYGFMRPAASASPFRLTI